MNKFAYPFLCVISSFSAGPQKVYAMEAYPANQLPIKAWAEDDRPREKMKLKGRHQLTDAELLAILLGSGTRSESALGLAQRILRSVENDLNELGKCSLHDLMRSLRASRCWDFAQICGQQAQRISIRIDLRVPGAQQQLEQVLKAHAGPTPVLLEVATAAGIGRLTVGGGRGLQVDASLPGLLRSLPGVSTVQVQLARPWTAAN